MTSVRVPCANNLSGAEAVYDFMRQNDQLRQIARDLPVTRLICLTYQKNIGCILLTPIDITDFMSGEDDPEIIRGVTTYQRYTGTTYLLVIEYYFQQKLKDRGVVIVEKSK